VELERVGRRARGATPADPGPATRGGDRAQRRYEAARARAPIAPFGRDLLVNRETVGDNDELAALRHTLPPLRIDARPHPIPAQGRGGREGVALACPAAFTVPLTSESRQ